MSMVDAAFSVTFDRLNPFGKSVLGHIIRKKAAQAQFQIKSNGPLIKEKRN
jgi:hypothetical protein